MEIFTVTLINGDDNGNIIIGADGVPLRTDDMVLLGTTSRNG